MIYTLLQVFGRVLRSDPSSSIELKNPHNPKFNKKLYDRDRTSILHNKPSKRSQWLHLYYFRSALYTYHLCFFLNTDIFCDYRSSQCIYASCSHYSWKIGSPSDLLSLFVLLVLLIAMKSYLKLTLHLMEKILIM